MNYEEVVRFWDLKNVGKYEQLDRKGRFFVDYSPDGKRLLSCANEAVAVVDRKHPSVALAELDVGGDRGPYFARFSEDGKRILLTVPLSRKSDVGRDGHQLMEWDPEGKRLTKSEVFKTGWQPWFLEGVDADKVLVMSAVAAVVWNPQTNKLTRFELGTRGMGIPSMERDSKLIAVPGEDNDLILLDGRLMKQLTFKTTTYAWSAGFSSKHRTLVIGYGNPFAPGPANDGDVGFRKIAALPK
ncbi:MAG: WD40 repeat domain-containing protein [Gemmataceae bacterium]|nr:WD40 repeat domain-containing protein [Gemmataceae bacterium]